jgi:hypothetical protein
MDHTKENTARRSPVSPVDLNHLVLKVRNIDKSHAFRPT